MRVKIPDEAGDNAFDEAVVTARFQPSIAERCILLAWAFTLPCTMFLSGGLFLLGRLLVK